MRTYLCRWTNGDCSVVVARNEQDAIIKLDEVANAEGCPIVELEEFQVHFRLTDDGELELESFGEGTKDEMWDFCYPVLDNAYPEVVTDPMAEHELQTVREAVVQERARVRAEEVAEPETELGRDIKKQLGAPTAVVEEIMREEGEDMLRRLKPPRKPH